MTISSFLSEHWGDVASVVGLGFAIWAALKAKTAAEQARDAAQEVWRRISDLDSMSDVSAAIATLDEIKRLQRLRAWNIVLDRYSSVRKHLVRVEQSVTGLTENQRNDVIGAISQFRTIEEKIEGAMATTPQSDPGDLTRFNQIVSAQIDKLEKVKIAIRQAKE